MDYAKNLHNILKVSGNRELIAYKMKKSTKTVERWANEETRPSPAEVEKLRRIINGILRRAVPLLSSMKGVAVK